MELRQTTYEDCGTKYMREEIAAPGEAHLACVLLLDTSLSMVGDPIASLNRAVNDFKEQTILDELARKRVDVAIIEFGNEARVIQEFTPLPEMEPVELKASGSTPMGAGINLAIGKVKERNRFYSKMGTPCYQPWIFMITDGAPTDDINAARERIKAEEAKGRHGKLKFFAVGVPGAEWQTLNTLTKRRIALEEAQFEGIFNWLSESVSTVSVSEVDENPRLPDLPEGAKVVPSDW